MSGIWDGLKYGIILNLAAVVLLPMATRFLGTQPGSGGTRPFGFGYGYFCSDSDGYCGGGGQEGGMGGGKHKKHRGGGYY